MFKAANNFDVLDPASGHPLFYCREPKLGTITKLLRFTDYKRMTPFNVEITSPDGRPAIRVQRGVSFFLSKVNVLDETETPVGGFKQKFFSIGGKFDVLDALDTPLCTLKGKWTGWDFQFVNNDGRGLARVTKKWSGLGKELLTSADNYMLEIDNCVPKNSSLRVLIMAAVMCIDMVLKE
jgi:uncharacterized protein YxjI